MADTACLRILTRDALFEKNVMTFGMNVFGGSTAPFCSFHILCVTMAAHRLIQEKVA